MTWMTLLSKIDWQDFDGRAGPDLAIIFILS
jgi:hypothetical protein